MMSAASAGQPCGDGRFSIRAAACWKPVEAKPQNKARPLSRDRAHDNRCLPRRFWSTSVMF
jgi:hypothetical protein